MRREDNTDFTFVAFTFGDGSNMHLTTTDASNPYSRSVSLLEFQLFCAWLTDANPETKPFVFGSDDVYAHVSHKTPSTIHFRSVETGDYLFTFIPISFLLSVLKRGGEYLCKRL